MEDTLNDDIEELLGEDQITKAEFGGLFTKNNRFIIADWQKAQDTRVHLKCIGCKLGFIRTRGPKQKKCIPCMFVKVSRYR
jgi:hypothetical protein